MARVETSCLQEAGGPGSGGASTKPPVLALSCLVLLIPSFSGPLEGLGGGRVYEDGVTPVVLMSRNVRTRSLA